MKIIARTRDHRDSFSSKYLKSAEDYIGEKYFNDEIGIDDQYTMFYYTSDVPEVIVDWVVDNRYMIWHLLEDGVEFNNICLSKDNKMKGEIIYFHTKEGKPFYVYKPLDIIHPLDIIEWREKVIDCYTQNQQLSYTFMKTLYWKLQEVSCVLVCRNRQWFTDNIKELETLWSTIEKERVSGYEHRAPNRRQKKDNNVDLMTKPSGGCLLQFNKDTGKITVIKNESSITINEIVINDNDDASCD